MKELCDHVFSFAAVAGFVLFLSFCGATFSAGPLDNWTEHPSGTPCHLNGIAYGNNMFVAVGAYNTILSSPDGQRWKVWIRSEYESKDSLYGVAFGNSAFVAVGENGKILASPDGLTWTEKASGTEEHLYGITYGNKKFAAVGSSGTVLTSPDGIRWTGIKTESTFTLRGIAWGNNTFIAVGEYGKTLISDGGGEWTEGEAGTKYTLHGIAYGNDTFVAVGTGRGTVMTSPGGEKWTRRNNGAIRDLRGIAYGNNMFVAVGERDIITSPDAVTWTRRVAGTFRYPHTSYRSVDFGKETFVVVGSSGRIGQSASFSVSAENSATVIPGEKSKEQGAADALINPLSYHGGFIRKPAPGVKIWTDSEHVFGNLPDFIEGKAYLLTTMRGGKALVMKSGYVHVITPTPVEAHMSGRFSRSAAGPLIPYFKPLPAQGFKRVEKAEEFKISATVAEPMAVYRKYAEEGEIIKFGRSIAIMVAGLPADYEDVKFEPPPPEVLAHKAPKVYTGQDEKYSFATRNFQGIPGIEISPNGRLWATWYACGCGIYTEGPENYSLLVTSKDGGKTWSDPPKVVVDPEDWPVRAFDPVPWHDPLGRLWFIWTQNDVILPQGTSSWAIITEDSTVENPAWSPPRKLAKGYMLNKPTVLTTGEWIFPSSNPGNPVDLYVSTDEGKTIEHLGAAEIPKAGYNEHIVIELKDGRLWLLARTSLGIGQSFSGDKGKTWEEGSLFWPGPSTRFHIRRLKSGRLLLVMHAAGETGRKKMTVYLSEDEGKTWPHQMLLDEGGSYPDAVEGPNGVIYVVQDHGGRNSAMNIMMHVFTEEDIIAGKITGKNSRLGMLISGRAVGR